MKKILYFVFFISLCFLINTNSAKAATGYCEYSLNSFNGGNAIYAFPNQNDVTIRFNVDTSTKKVTIDWNSNYNIFYESSTQLQVEAPNYNSIYFNLKFAVNNLYSKMVKGSEFSCPNIYGLYDINTSSLDIYDSAKESSDSNESVQLRLLNESKPTGLEGEKELGKCGIGIVADQFGLPKNMTVEFTKYSTRKEVCVNYSLGGSFCEDYNNSDIYISTEVNSTSRTFVFYQKDLQKVFDNVNEDSNSCINLWVDTTRSNSHLFIFTTENTGSGQDVEMTTEDYDQALKNQQLLNGTTYQVLLGKLKPAINALNPIALTIKLQIGANENATLNDVQANDGLCSGNDCFQSSEYLTEQGLKEIRQYCNTVYNVYPDHKTNSDAIMRMDECVSFNTFYSELVKRGIINSLEDDCKIIPEELADKLDFILDILKIAGPLLALGLGTLDFIKVIANGDADKEMKTAFKRFMTRLIAAALLFIIPFVLAFLLDIFLTSDDGYNSDNPFCSVIDWDE